MKCLRYPAARYGGRVVLLTGILCGLAPALRGTRADPAVAQVLACVGLYGFMALGSRRDQVLWLVLGETLWLGIAAGVPLSLWAAGYAKSPLFGIS